MKNKSWIIILLLLTAFPLMGQERPMFNHFYASPYLYNPSFAGDDFRPAILISHRRQWMGVEGAPVTSNIIFHTPLGDKFAFGLQFNNDTRGILNSSTGLLTIAYKAMFNPEHFLKFGLSGGVTNRSLREWDEIMNDPRYQDDEAVLKLLEKSMYLDGRFGMSYHLKGFNLGFTMPRLFSEDLFGDKEFNEIKLNPLNAYQIMAHYKTYNKTAPIAFEPYLVFRLQQDTGEKQLEGAGILRIKNSVWLGGIYRQNAGITAVGGITINDVLSFGYSYDIAGQSITSITKGTHEIALKLNFGEEKRPKKRERQIERKEQNKTDIAPDNREKTPVEVPENIFDLDGKIRNYSGPLVVREGRQRLDIKKGYYVVIGVFNNLERVENYSNILFQSGYYTKYGFNSESNYYYLYIYFSADDRNSAEAFKDEIDKRPLFSGSWILTVQ